MVVLDLMMPRMNGLDAFRAIRALRPRVPVVISTGYASDDMAARCMAEGAEGILAKPYVVSELCDVLSRCNRAARVSI